MSFIIYSFIEATRVFRVELLCCNVHSAPLSVLSVLTNVDTVSLAASCSSSEFPDRVFPVRGEDHRPGAEGRGPVFPLPLFPLQHLFLHTRGGALHHG